MYYLMQIGFVFGIYNWLIWNSTMKYPWNDEYHAKKYVVKEYKLEWNTTMYDFKMFVLKGRDKAIAFITDYAWIGNRDKF